jgi:hypothetical protein
MPRRCFIDENDEETMMMMTTTRGLHRTLKHQWPTFRAFKVDRFRNSAVDAQKRIDDSMSHLDQFLDKYAKDASTMERMAMSSITEQLPRRAVSLDEETEQSTTTTSTANKQYKSSLDFAGTRVSREQEIHLRALSNRCSLAEVRTDAEGYE